jgi:hypothetical protein
MRKKQMFGAWFHPLGRKVSAYILATGVEMAPHLLGNDLNT